MQALNAITSVLKERQREFDTQRKWGYEKRTERDLKMLALNTGVMQPQVKKCWPPTEGRRGKEQILSYSLGRECDSANTLTSAQSL